MIKKPMLSIMIATKNRIPYCIHVIETILKFPDQDFELVIQDNSDTLELKEYCDVITDKRFKYNYTPPPFSSIDNFNKVISLSKGQYSCLIGDDDGINPDIFKIVRYASANNIDSIVPSLKAIYWWPDATKNIKGKENYNGLLSIGHLSSNIEILSTEGEVEKLMKSGGQEYMNLNLPKLYHGVVKTKYLQNIKEKTGSFVGGLSPDIYISVALACFIKKIVRIDYPLVIPGICIASTSADSATKTNTSKLEDAPHFRDRGEYYWAKQVPKFYSGVNIWADSAIASLTDLDQLKLVDKFSITDLVIVLLNRHNDYSNIILKHYFESYNATSYLQRSYYLIALKLKKSQYKFIKFSVRVIGKFKRSIVSNKFKNKPENIHSVLNISQANDKLNQHLAKHSLSVDLIIKRLDTAKFKSNRD